MSEGQTISPSLRSTIKEHLRAFYQNWLKNGTFAKVLYSKTKNGALKLKPGHIKEVLSELFHKVKNGIISFVKKVLTAPVSFVRMIVAFMILEFIEDRHLQLRLMAKFATKKLVKQ